MTLRPHRVGAVVERLESVPSTMDAVKELDKDGAVVVAAEQTAGRGRKGRAWHSPEGGLYLSALLKAKMAPKHLGLVPLWTGLAAAETAAKWGVEPRLKWPNDVLVGKRKLAGVLAESALRGRRVDRVVVGVGLNVNNVAFPPGVPGTSLRQELGEAQDLDAVLDDLLARLTAHYDAFLDEPTGFLDDYERHCATVGLGVAVQTAAGGTVRGTALAVGDEGELLVRTAGGEGGAGGVVRLREGDVADVEAAAEGGPGAPGPDAGAAGREPSTDEEDGDQGAPDAGGGAAP